MGCSPIKAVRELGPNCLTTFSIIGVAMIAAAVLAALVFTGLLPIPVGNGFSEKIKYAEVGDVPCPIQSAKPVPPSHAAWC